MIRIAQVVDGQHFEFFARLNHITHAGGGEIKATVGICDRAGPGLVRRSMRCTLTWIKVGVL